MKVELSKQDCANLYKALSTASRNENWLPYEEVERLRRKLQAAMIKAD